MNAEFSDMVVVESSCHTGSMLEETGKWQLRAGKADGTNFPE